MAKYDVSLWVHIYYLLRLSLSYCKQIPCLNRPCYKGLPIVYGVWYVYDKFCFLFWLIWTVFMQIVWLICPSLNLSVVYLWVQITGVSVICSTVCSGADQRKQQRSASLAFVRESHRWTDGFPSQRAAENVSIWWRQHVAACPEKEQRQSYIELREVT